MASNGVEAFHASPIAFVLPEIQYLRIVLGSMLDRCHICGQETSDGRNRFEEKNPLAGAKVKRGDFPVGNSAP